MECFEGNIESQLNNIVLDNDLRKKTNCSKWALIFRPYLNVYDDGAILKRIKEKTFIKLDCFVYVFTLYRHSWTLIACCPIMNRIINKQKFCL